MTLFQKEFLDLTLRFGERPLLDDERIGAFSIEETYRLSKQTAARLYSLGYRPGEGLVIKATRSASTTVLLYASQMLGLIAVLVDFRADAASIMGLDPRIKGIACQNDEANDILSWEISHLETSISLQIPDIHDENVDFPEVERLENSDAVWVFTSGSEGQYKVVRHSQETLFSHCKRYHAPSSCDETDRGVVLLPLFHVFGLALIYIPIVVGFSIYFPASLELDYIIDYCIKKEITYLDSVPSFQYALAKRVEERGIQIPSLRNGLTGGAPMERGRFQEMERILGMKLLPVYGASEIIAIAALGEEGSEERRWSTVGQPIPDTIMKILDENGNPVKQGEMGEITVKSPSLMLGYLGKDSGIDENGFFSTGDIGYLDENGDLHISGRKKQIIIRNGNNLSIVEIENRLLKVAGVKSACVVTLPSQEVGEVPGAMISILEGEDISEIQDRIEAELPKLLLPEKILFTPALPLLPSGKYDRVQIKKALMEE